MSTVGDHRFFIALGSNLGDRLDHLRKAAHLMIERLPEARLTAAAPVYESAPVDCPEGSGTFLNSVVEVGCRASAHEVLAVLRGIEGDLGRPGRRGRHEPRTIDLDILCAGDLVVKDAELVLPHPRLTERRFVLQPLADIAPGLVLPGLARSMAELLANLAGDEPPLRLVSRDWT